MSLYFITDFTGTSVFSRYQVWDRDRTILYTGLEQGSFVTQFILGPFRWFRIVLYDPEGNPALVIRRRFNPCLWFFGGHYCGSVSKLRLHMYNVYVTVGMYIW